MHVVDRGLWLTLLRLEELSLSADTMSMLEFESHLCDF